MASNYQVKQLSTPAVYINGDLIAVLPNTVVVHEPIEAHVRSVSLGGGATQIVFGIDATKFVGHVAMEVAATAENADRTELYKQNLKNGLAMQVLVIEDTSQFPHQQMYLSKATDIHFKADGSIKWEFEGSGPNTG